MEMLRTKSPEMVRKEVAIHLLAYNLIRGIMAEAARVVEVKPRMLSFTGALHTVRSFEESHLYDPTRIEADLPRATDANGTEPMQKLLREYRHFLSYPRDMRILLLTNLIYALVGPVIDIFVGAYVMRNSRNVRMVVTYQLAVYAGIPFAFLINGFLLQHVAIKRLYSLGMLLSGVSMAVMMALGTLSLTGIGVAGLLMSMSFGLFWANRDFLALSTTTDANRNYYYGIETFFYTNTYVVVPAAIGWFIEATALRGWFGGDRNHAYQIVTGVVFVLTVLSSIVAHRGRFENPPRSPFVFFRYHWLWNRMQLLAVLKGLAQGYIVTAPAMLILRHVGQEGALGTIQAVGGIVSAFLLYLIGRTTRPEHRIAIFTVGLVLFTLGGLSNALLSTLPACCCSCSACSWPARCTTSPISRSRCRSSMPFRPSSTGISLRTSSIRSSGSSPAGSPAASCSSCWPPRSAMCSRCATPC